MVLLRKYVKDIYDVIGIAFMLAAVIMLGVSVFLCFSNDIWYDELFTMGLANQSFGELISITGQDVHPPFYYMIVKWFLPLGRLTGISDSQVVFAKVLSVLPFFLCINYAMKNVRRRFGMFSAGLFSFLLMSMPQLADYSVEVRMYGYALLFIIVGMIHAYEIVIGEKGKCSGDWISLTFFALAACYTHYFACVAAVMIYVYLLLAFCVDHRVKQMIKSYLLSGVLCALGFLPWILYAVVSQVGTVKENYWIQPLSIRTLGGCVKFLFSPVLGNGTLNLIVTVILFLGYAALLVKMLLKWKKMQSGEEKQKAFWILGCIGILVGIVLFGFVASALVRPIFVYRYMLPALGVFWLAFAILCSKELMQWKNKIIVSVFMIFLFLVGVVNYRSFYGEEMWKRVQMKTAEEALAQIEKEDVIIYNFDQAQAVVSYYLDNDTYLWYGEPEDLICQMYPHNYSLVGESFSDEAGIDAVKKLIDSGKPVWFIGSGNARDEIIEKWNTAGIEATETNSVMIERYWFNIYELKRD